MFSLQTITSIIALVAVLSFTGQAQQQENQPNDRQHQQRQQQQPQQQQQQEPQQRQQQAPQQRQQAPQQRGGNTDVSDSELKKFAEIQNEVQEVREGTRKEMMSAVEDEGLDVNQFSKIRRAQMSGDSTAQAQVSDAELQKFKKAQEEMQKVQQKAQKKVQKKIEKSGISTQRFEEISTAVKQDRELQQKLQNMQGGGQQR